MNMESKLIKILEALGKFAKISNNCTQFEIDFDDVGNLMNSGDKVYCLNGKIGSLNTPIPFSRDIEKFFDDLLSSEVGTESPNDSEYSYYEMIVDTVSRKITIYGIYNETEVSESYSEEIDLEGEEKELFWNDLYSEIGNDLRTFDVEIIGGGDSGYFECALHRLPNDVEEILYGILEDKAPGWEINEGSSGRFVINPNEKTIRFILDVYEEESKQEEEYVYIY
jgi:hypothetical protein